MRDGIVRALSVPLASVAIVISLTGCQVPELTAPNAVYCAATTEPPISGGMKREFVSSETLWRPLTDWLDAGVETRRKRCG